MKRETIRKGATNLKNNEIFLYGRLRPRNRAKAYCMLHKCYLEAIDIKEKGCNYKRCTYKREVKTK